MSHPAQREVTAVAASVAKQLSGTDHAVDVTLSAVAPLEEGFPPRSPLLHLARTVAHPATVTTVRPLKPPHRWPSHLQQTLESIAAHPGKAEATPGAPSIAATVEHHLGTVRMAAEAVVTEPGDYASTWRRDFVLVTATHIALLTVTIDD
ncbi:hypothetical protein [Streptomyces sp. NPDC049585]|uniref:hypothetical protein n=1 Tax=Streptomyces sp. NPDC049585 TaxID=3155154 RepID=UPI003422DC21